MSLISYTKELVEMRGLRIYLYANGIVRSNSDIISDIRNESPFIWIFFNKTLFPLSGWTSDVKFDLKFNNINHTLSIFIDDIEAIVVSLFEIYPYNRYPVKAVFGWFDDMNTSITNQTLYFKDIEYKIEGSVMIKPLTVTKNIKENGIYMATDDNADGYSSVTVNVSSLLPMDKVVFSTDAVPIAAQLYYPLSAADIDVTCYGVLAAPHHSYGGDGEIALLNIPYESSNGNDPAFYSPNHSLDLYATVYGNNELISGISVADYHVYTITINAATKKARYYVDGVYYLEKTFVHSGNVVCLGCGDAPDGRTLNGRRLLCKYLGVVESLESDDNIIMKQQELMEKYGIT